MCRSIRHATTKAWSSARGSSDIKLTDTPLRLPQQPLDDVLILEKLKSLAKVTRQLRVEQYWTKRLTQPHIMSGNSVDWMTIEEFRIN
jgi:hypothetical protein